jgi:hypothetical protein
MALSFPDNPTTGDQYTDANSKTWEFDGVKWNIATSLASKTFIGVKVERSSEVSLGSALSLISFNSAPYDTTALFDSNTPTRITIKRNGFYRVNMVILTNEEGYGQSYTVNLKKTGTINLLNDRMAANQGATFDEIVELDAGDYLELYASEDGDVGGFLAGTFIEVSLAGYNYGANLTPGFEFSGVRAELQNSVNMTTSETAITWTANDMIFNINANSAGAQFWNDVTPTRFTISTTGYYRLKSFIEVSAAGSGFSYDIAVVKNGTTDVVQEYLGGSEEISLDETFYLTNGDYLEVTALNSDNIGQIVSGSTYFEITRLGV